MIIDWASVANGSAIDNDAFAQMTADERRTLLQQGLKWVAAHAQAAPAEGYRVTGIILHLLDAYDLQEEGLRSTASHYLATTALSLGRTDEAVLQFRALLSEPRGPANERHRLLAKINLAAVIVIFGIVGLSLVVLTGMEEDMFPYRNQEPRGVHCAPMTSNCRWWWLAAATFALPDHAMKDRPQ